MKRRFTFAALLIAIGGWIISLNHQAPAQAAPQRIEVTAKRYSFDPGEITVKTSQPVVLVLKSADVSHGLRFRELNLEVNARKGSVAELRFTPDKVGDFVGRCSVFCGSGHGKMALTIHVTK